MISKQVTIIIFSFLLTQLSFGLEKNEYIISFKPIEMNNMDTNYTHLANSYPMLLYSELQFAADHKYSNDEILALKEKQLKILEIEYYKELSVLKEKYDRAIFTNNIDENEKKLISEEIITKNIEIEKLNINIIPTPEPVVSVKYNNIDEINNTDISELESSDLIIKGSMEQLEGWVYIEIRVENKILQEEKLIFKTISSPENLSDHISEITYQLKTIILGRNWASITFNLEPEASNILLKTNGKPVMEDFSCLNPLKYNIEISKPGYITKELTVQLDDFENLVIDVKLLKEEKGIISLQSFPQGADIYSGSIWIGESPLLVVRPVTPSLLTFKLEGFNDSKYIYSNSDIRDIKITMESAIINRNKIIQNKRNIFYKSFSYFLLSIPVSVLSFGMSSDYGYAYNNEVLISLDSSEANRLMQLSTTWYNIYLGSLFINVSLFVNTIFDLVDYIKSNNYL